MKSREFIIKTDALDIDIEEYLEEDLEVPSEFIESLHIEDTHVNIKLSHTREYFNDDWYVNLQRVS